MIEQLFANQVRLFEEDSSGSGSPAGNVAEPRLAAAAAGRQVISWEASTTPFRVPSVRSPIHEAWTVRTSFELSAQIVETLLLPHMSSQGAGVYTLDREGPEPTFCLQMETEDGDLIEFRGLAIGEIGISLANNQIGSVAVTWQALERITGNALEAVVTPSPAATPETLIGPGDAAVALKTGELSADTRDDVITCFGFDFFFSRPGLQVTNFGPDGTPTAHEKSPWRITGAIGGLWDGLADTAASGQISGAAGLLLGPDGADLDLRFAEATVYLDSEPIKQDEFREARYLLEIFGDATASLLEVRT